MIKLAVLYPELLNLYGDRGNVVALQKQAEWNDIALEVIEVRMGDRIAWGEIDLIFFGGGSDREQGILSQDLKEKVPYLKEHIEANKALLAICGGYQLLGDYYQDVFGNQIEGLNLLNFYTKATNQRMVGNLIIEATLDGKSFYAVGFENHAGKTYHHYQPLGRVITGFGNNGEDRFEGLIYKNVIGSYLHGPILPKNPEITFALLSRVSDEFQEKYITGKLKNYDLELQAKESIIKRFAKEKEKVTAQ